MILGFGNNVTAKLTSDITFLQIELPVDVGSGNLFAKLLTTDMNNEDTSHKIFAKVTLTNLQGSVSEICHFTAVSGDTLTVIRGQEGTVSRGWKLGDVVANFATRGSEKTFVQIEQLQGGDYAYAAALGTANNLVVNLPSTYTTDSWDLKTPIVITPIYNNSGQVTMQLILGGSVIGTFPIYKDNNSPLVRSDIIAGIPFLVLLDKTKTFFNIINGNYLSLTGGTVTGDTNFTAKLQNKGNDVTPTYIGEFRNFPFRKNKLPKGWYLRDGKLYDLNSKVGKALNSLDDDFKTDWNIKAIDGKINIPNAFDNNMKGYFERPVNGLDREVGSVQGDAIRNIVGEVATPKKYENTPVSGVFKQTGTNGRTARGEDYDSGSGLFDLNNINYPIANEIRPINIGMTPAIYLGV